MSQESTASASSRREPSDPGKLAAEHTAGRRRMAALVVAALVLVALSYGLGAHLAGARAMQPPPDELAERLSQVRDCIERGAWVAPKEECVQSLLLRLSRRWPTEPRVAAARVEAAERLIAEAVGLRYEGHPALAAERVRLAIEFLPDYETAKRFLRELEGRPEPAAKPIEGAPLPTRSPDGPAAPWRPAPAPLPGPSSP